MNLKKYRAEANQQFEEVLLRQSNRVMEAASIVLNKKIILNIKRPDQLRLLNLVTWSDKFNLTIEEILKVLLKVWSNKYKAKSAHGIGVAISTLCGPKSRQILIEYIKKQYPDRENADIKKQELLNTMLPIIDVSSREDPLQFIKNYKKSIKLERKKIEDVENKLKRRRWRGNPVY